MLHFRNNACDVLAHDTRSTVAQFDQAYLASLRMAATIVETFDGSGLPAGQSQRVYSRMNAGIGRLMEGRGEIVSVIAHLLAIKGQSNVAETDLGCPGPWSDVLTVLGEAQPA
jgi:hypothetical protein